MYVKIKSNKPVGNVRVTEMDPSSMTPCDCDPNSANPCGPDTDCLNRYIKTFFFFFKFYVSRNMTFLLVVSSDGRKKFSW
jgi:hypothetical protein